MTRSVLIVWHSRTGAARQMAHAMAEGAAQAARDMGEDCHVVWRDAGQVTCQDMMRADGYAFCAPENLASLSGEMKAFFDRHYYDLLDAVAGRPYVAGISAGSDGESAARQVTRICTGWRLTPLTQPLIVRTHAQTPEAILAPKTLDATARESCMGLGGLLAATLLLGS